MLQFIFYHFLHEAERWSLLRRTSIVLSMDTTLTTMEVCSIYGVFSLTYNFHRIFFVFVYKSLFVNFMQYFTKVFFLFRVFFIILNCPAFAHETIQWKLFRYNTSINIIHTTSSSSVYIILSVSGNLLFYYALISARL